MKHLLNILHLEDDRLAGDLIRETLAAEGTVAEMQLVQTEGAFRAALQGGNVDLVLADYSLPGFDGLSALKIAQETKPDIPFIFVSGTVGEDVVINSLKSGATDFVLKERLQRLGVSVHRALNDVKERRLNGDATREQVLLDLRASEQRLRTVLESLPDGLVISDLDGQLLIWNKAALEIHGFGNTEECLLKLPDFAKIFELSDLDGAPLTVDQWPLARVIRGEQLSKLEIQVRRLEGNWRRVFSYGGGTVREANGRLVAFLTIADITQRTLLEDERARDIAQRKDAEVALKASEVRYRRLFESARDGILILNGDSGEIVDANPYLIELLASTKEELTGKELWEIGTFRDIAASKAAFEELQARDYVRYDDLPLQSSDGTETYVEVVANGYVEGDERVVQCNIRDITERRLTRADLEETNQRLKAALTEVHAKRHELSSMTQQLWQASKLATMGELAASVAHELNNPLATLALHAESLLTQMSADDPEREAVQVIDQEVERMATLVSNLLLFSRRGHQQTSTLNMIEELRNSLEFLNYHLRSQAIAVVTEFAADLPSVHADGQQLRQLFLNLLTNGSDAMPSGGTFTVRAKAGTLQDGAAAVVIEFADTGTGIHPEDIPRLWEPFFTTKPEGKGTGLGLSICRRTVEEHHGTIELESQPGKGTTVRITLPAVNSVESRA